MCNRKIIDKEKNITNTENKIEEKERKPKIAVNTERNAESVMSLDKLFQSLTYKYDA